MNREPCSQAQTPRIRVCQAHFDQNHAIFCREYRQMKQTVLSKIIVTVIYGNKLKNVPDMTLF